ncbi:EutP/PduV family microcompartment system protein [Cohnella sp. 56]|uniref:EutP/PduV family microcompartment system protein n=1 Tax=Cohnella sp. 56 TaxID=3113722 RepID=UPI0030E93CB9
MKKILIIGIVASGKTTLAKRLSQTIRVPWYELDSIVHHQTPAGQLQARYQDVENDVQMDERFRA